MTDHASIDDAVVLAAGLTDVQAHAMRAHLEDEEISAAVVPSGTMGTTRDPATQEHGLLLIVARHDRDRAEAALATVTPVDMDDADQEAIGASVRRPMPLLAWAGFAVACLLVLIMLVGFVLMLIS